MQTGKLRKVSNEPTWMHDIFLTRESKCMPINLIDPRGRKRERDPTHAYTRTNGGPTCVTQERLCFAHSELCVTHVSPCESCCRYILLLHLRVKLEIRRQSQSESYFRECYVVTCELWMLRVLANNIAILYNYIKSIVQMCSNYLIIYFASLFFSSFRILIYNSFFMQNIAVFIWVIAN